MQFSFCSLEIYLLLYFYPETQAIQYDPVVVALATDLSRFNLGKRVRRLVRSDLHPTYFALHYMGGLLSVARLAFPPKSTWSVHDIPDLTGKVILVTGACPKRNKYACARLLNWT